MTLLHLENVSMQFAGSNKPSLQNINYKIHQGEFIILLGSNGSGKSTLLKLLQKQFQPDNGVIHIKTQTRSLHSTTVFHRQIALLNQNCSEALFNSLTIHENYLLMKPKNNRDAQHGSEYLFLKKYLSDFNPNLSDKLDVTVNHLSGGEKQALALAFCILLTPALLLLDEHTSALDPKTSEQIMQLTQKMISLHGITCILTTHDMDIALRYGDRILMLQDGKILNCFDKQEKSRLNREQLVSCYY